MARIRSRLITVAFVVVALCCTLPAAAQNSPGSQPFQFSPLPPTDAPVVVQAQATQPLATTPQPAVQLPAPPVLSPPPPTLSPVPVMPAPIATLPAKAAPVAAPVAAPALVQAASPPSTLPPAPPAVATAPAAPQPEVQLVDMESLKQALGPELYKAWEIVAKIWDIGLVNDSQRKPVVTVGTLVCGIVLMGLGYIAAGMISRWMATKLLTRFGLSKSGVAPLQSIAFYALLATFTMVSLNVLSVPLTVFSFLGGALAIGAGFGSQNIVNNFISGLILLAERPIRVGDVIQLDSWTGTVTQIGARSTKIANGSNHEIIVPNSKLLETSVVNWTLSDDTVGCTVTVGAAYGSPTREVQRLLLLAAQQHPHILKDPQPQVVFADFGADSLSFELKFWLNLRQSSKGEVESDLRFAIDELFADRGLVIAYPQRDVHLNVLRPVEVRLTQPVSHMKAAA